MLVYMGPKPKEGKELTIDEALIILSNRIRPSGDSSAILSLKTLTNVFEGAEKRFFCPECGGSHFGSSNCQGPESEMIGHCHSCRRTKGFEWPRTDDDKYFRWVITLPANMLEDKPRTVSTAEEETDEEGDEKNEDPGS
jgi:transcription elongation factor Elf1